VSADPNSIGLPFKVFHIGGGRNIFLGEIDVTISAKSGRVERKYSRGKSNGGSYWGDVVAFHRVLE
jgi:hypothetical protein